MQVGTISKVSLLLLLSAFSDDSKVSHLGHVLVVRCNVMSAELAADDDDDGAGDAERKSERAGLLQSTCCGWQREGRFMMVMVRAARIRLAGML